MNPEQLTRVDLLMVPCLGLAKEIKGKPSLFAGASCFLGQTNRAELHFSCLALSASSASHVTNPVSPAPSTRRAGGTRASARTAGRRRHEPRPGARLVRPPKGHPNQRPGKVAKLHPLPTCQSFNTVRLSTAKEDCQTADLAKL